MEECFRNSLCSFRSNVFCVWKNVMSRCRLNWRWCLKVVEDMCPAVFSEQAFRSLCVRKNVMSRCHERMCCCWPHVLKGHLVLLSEFVESCCSKLSLCFASILIVSSSSRVFFVVRFLSRHSPQKLCRVFFLVFFF
jgi:hypothetical protein